MKMVPKVKKAITIILQVVETCDVFQMAHIPCSVLFQNSDVPNTQLVTFCMNTVPPNSGLKISKN